MVDEAKLSKLGDMGTPYSIGSQGRDDSLSRAYRPERTVRPWEMTNFSQSSSLPSIDLPDPGNLVRRVEKGLIKLSMVSSELSRFRHFAEVPSSVLHLLNIHDFPIVLDAT